ncbi:Erp protein [Myxococcus sp. AM011]|nr:Erp protein [Myxococcus sp. AM011]
MAKHLRRWMWAGAMAGTLALGTACSSTEAPIVVAQADTSTTGQQPATGGSGSTTSPSTSPSTTPDTMTQDPSQTAPANPGTVPATPEQNPGSATVPSDSTTTTPDTTTTAPGTTSTPTFDGDAGMGGSGVVPGTTDDNTSGTVQPPPGGAVMDGGTY